MSHTPIDPDVAAYMAAVAKALQSVPPCKTTYGEFYISEALVSYDGDATGYAVVADEHGGYSLAFDLHTTRSHPTHTEHAGDDEGVA